MTEIPDYPLQRLRQLTQQQQKIEERRQDILKTLCAAQDLDPATSKVDLQEGVIREVESE